MDAEPKIPTAIEGLETFTLNDDAPAEDAEPNPSDFADADSFFNLPDGANDDAEEGNSEDDNAKA